MRTYRDVIWKNSKGHAVCTEYGIRFTEDLLQVDKDAREAVWPQIQKARKEGKSAYYRGPTGYINHRPIKPDEAIAATPKKVTGPDNNSNSNEDPAASPMKVTGPDSATSSSSIQVRLSPSPSLSPHLLKQVQDPGESGSKINSDVWH